MLAWPRKFVKFAAVSGVGLTCDLVIFTILLVLMDFQTITANIISSYFGLTVVYLVSVRFVFKKHCRSPGPLLILYWLYHGISIPAYSLGIAWLAGLMRQLLPSVGEELLAKVVITPCILATNFAFMWGLTRFMEDRLIPGRELRAPLNSGVADGQSDAYGRKRGSEASRDAQILN